ncbi:MAG: hypothetical protein ABW151_07730, partial [Pseudorhodoplanes sp.]
GNSPPIEADALSVRRRDAPVKGAHEIDEIGGAVLRRRSRSFPLSTVSFRYCRKLISQTPSDALSLPAKVVCRRIDRISENKILRVPRSDVKETPCPSSVSPRVSIDR